MLMKIKLPDKIHQKNPAVIAGFYMEINTLSFIYSFAGWGAEEVPCWGPDLRQ